MAAPALVTMQHLVTQEEYDLRTTTLEGSHELEQDVRKKFGTWLFQSDLTATSGIRLEWHEITSQQIELELLNPDIAKPLPYKAGDWLARGYAHVTKENDVQAPETQQTDSTDPGAESAQAPEGTDTPGQAPAFPRSEHPAS